LFKHPPPSSKIKNSRVTKKQNSENNYQTQLYKNNDICILHCNIQGLQNKANELEVLFDNTKPSIVLLTEHWVAKANCNNININGYDVVSAYGRDNQNRGGVCILAKPYLSLEKVAYSRCIETNFEAALARGIINNKKIIIANIYRTPNSDYDIFLTKFSEMMNYIYQKGEILVVDIGDTNVNLLNNNKEKKQLLNMLLEYNMQPTIYGATRTTTHSATSIDNIFTNMAYGYTQIGDTHLSDHSYQMVHLKVNDKQKEKCIEKRNFNEPSKEIFLNSLVNADWSRVYEQDDVDHAYEEFFKEFKYHFDVAFPKKKRKCKTIQDNPKKWVTPQIKELTAMVREMVPIEKRLNCRMYTERYKELKKCCNTLVTNTKKSFNDKRITQSSNISKECWKIINENRRKQNEGLPKRITTDSSTTTNADEISNMLNHYFTDIKVNQQTNISQAIRQPVNFFLWPVPEIEVINKIDKHCTKPSSGCDEIPGTIVKLVKNTIATPLTHIVNLCFKLGIFPKKLKTSKVVPVYKQKGNKDDLTNYRPLSLQSHFSKIIESCYHDQLCQYMQKFDLISQQQHGYRKSRSTITAIYEAVSSILNSLNNKEKVAGIFLDMSRAFDTVNHMVLLNKAERMGVRGVPLMFIESYLKGRSQVVTVNGSISESKETFIGLPQGTILSPLLFSIMMNDLPIACPTANTMVIYADDSNMIITDTIKENLVMKCRNAVKEMQQWCINNGIILNTNKTQTIEFLPANGRTEDSMLIQVDRKSIKQVNQTKFLGVHIDNKIRWNTHTEYLEAKLSSLCYSMKTIKCTVTDKVLRITYYALVQSIMSYGVIFWALAADAPRILIMQKKILRIIEGANWRTHCKPLFKKWKILTLPSLYILNVVRWIKNNEDSFTKNNEVHEYLTRNKENIHLRFQRLTVAQNSPEYMGAKIFNSLPQRIQQIQKKKILREELLNYLLERPYYNLEEFFEEHSRL